jgi:fibronectin type 3 domain-containing protein
MTKKFKVEIPLSMTKSHHLFQIGLFLLVITGCSASDSTLPSGDTLHSGDTLPSGTATLSWDASRGPDLAGYKIYQATASGAYETPIAALTMDITSYTVTGLEVGTTYFFAVTAYTSDGTESSFSNEESKNIL